MSLPSAIMWQIEKPCCVYPKYQLWNNPDYETADWAGCLPKNQITLSHTLRHMFKVSLSPAINDDIPTTLQERHLKVSNRKPKVTSLDLVTLVKWSVYFRLGNDISNFAEPVVCILLDATKILYTIHYFPPFPITFISLQHILVRLGKFLLLWMVCRQQTRNEPGHGGSASRLVSREGSACRLPQWPGPLLRVKPPALDLSSFRRPIQHLLVWN